jgi:hypothetical protein
MAPTNKRTERARENHTLAILSRNSFFVARQTPRRLDASHSLKPADFPFRCPHAWQGVKRLLAPSRCLSELISALYRSQTQKPAKCNPYKEFFHNCPPSTFLLSLASLVTIVHNSTFVLVGMISILSSTLVLQYFCTIVYLYYSIFVLQYASTIVGLYYSTFVLQYNCIVVRLYYSTPVLLKMILIISSTFVL